MSDNFVKIISIIFWFCSIQIVVIQKVYKFDEHLIINFQSVFESSFKNRKIFDVFERCTSKRLQEILISKKLLYNKELIFLELQFKIISLLMCLKSIWWLSSFSSLWQKRDIKNIKSENENLWRFESINTMTSAVALQFESIFSLKHIRTKRRKTLRKFEISFRVNLQD